MRDTRAEGHAAHTDDDSQLMAAGYHGQPGFGKGDLNGLRRLHDVPCD